MSSLLSAGSNFNFIMENDSLVVTTNSAEVVKIDSTNNDFQEFEQRKQSISHFCLGFEGNLIEEYVFGCFNLEYAFSLNNLILNFKFNAGTQFDIFTTPNGNYVSIKILTGFYQYSQRAFYHIKAGLSYVSIRMDNCCWLFCSGCTSKQYSGIALPFEFSYGFVFGNITLGMNYGVSFVPGNSPAHNLTLNFGILENKNK